MVNVNQKIALVTGANRGLGLETCRQLAKKGFMVILTARNWKSGSKAAKQLQAEKLDVLFHKLDVTERKSIKEIADYIESDYGKLDVLVNNAGVSLDKRRDGSFPAALDTKIGTIRDTMETNVYGPFRLIKFLTPMLVASGNGIIINVSSRMGAMEDMKGGWSGYRISKSALNALTLIFADELKDSNIKVNAVCPGWVRTDMGGQDAHRTIEEGADGIVKLATIGKNGPTGKFFRDGKEISW
jgi:NAD(P)-dependent dehydrogenase (short-subunit alcohol dehydrogenase family)